jgi:acetyl esterase/lipase
LIRFLLSAALVFALFSRTSDRAYGAQSRPDEKHFEEVLRTSVSKQLGPFPLYPSDIPNSKPGPDKETSSVWLDMVLISDVSRPTYTVYLPPASRASGVAVLVFPGGGYHDLSWDMEGRWIAQALQDRGIAAILLKYRLPSDETMLDKAIGPLQDAQQAMLLTRRKAASWGIDPQKIGAIGFSAGGHLASMLGTQFDPPLIDNPQHESLRPDFLILVYPVISFADGRVHPDMRSALIGAHPSAGIVEKFSSNLHVTAQTPPTLLMAASNDTQVNVDHSLDFYRALREHGVPAQLILFERGEHGFFELTRDEWMGSMWAWMSRSGFLNHR